MSEAIEYRFSFSDGKRIVVSVPFSDHDVPQAAELPAWTRLGVCQCPNCPIQDTACSHCPVAVRLCNIAEQFSGIISYTRAEVAVLVGERTFLAQCDINTSLRSLMGLGMSLSACPIMGRLRPLAKSHLPFASLEETAGRVVRAYLYKQYFVMKDGGTPDWEFKGLIALYESLNTATIAFMTRLREASTQDANLNAVMGLAGYSAFFTMGLHELIEEEKQDVMNGF